jgi:hypothetical protein
MQKLINNNNAVLIYKGISIFIIHNFYETEFITRDN